MIPVQWNSVQDWMRLVAKDVNPALAKLDRMAILTEATGDGLTDDTGKIQSAIDALYSKGGGELLLPTARYKINGQVQVPAGVQLRGLARGPFDNTALPTSFLIGPTFLITNTSTAPFDLVGGSAKISDVLFYWPNQVAVTAATPIAYPYAIELSNGEASQAVERCTFVNAYNGIDVQTGRSCVSDCLIGAFHNDIRVDGAQDWVELHNIKCQLMWNVFSGALPMGQPIDTWVMNNSTALILGRADSIQATNFSIFGRYIGHQATRATGTGYGRFSNVDMDFVAYGIVADGTNAGAYGYHYENLDIAANASGVGTAGQATIVTNSGASAADKPYITWASGHKRGAWATTGPSATVRNDGMIYIGEDVRGVRPAGILTAPTPPASTATTTNTYPFPVDIVLVFTGGAATVVNKNGNGTGLAGSNLTVRLGPGETISPTYPGALAWTWWGV